VISTLVWPSTAVELGLDFSWWIVVLRGDHLGHLTATERCSTPKRAVTSSKRMSLTLTGQTSPEWARQPPPLFVGSSRFDSGPSCGDRFTSYEHAGMAVGPVHHHHSIKLAVELGVLRVTAPPARWQRSIQLGDRPVLEHWPQSG